MRGEAPWFSALLLGRCFIFLFEEAFLQRAVRLLEVLAAPPLRIATGSVASPRRDLLRLPHRDGQQWTVVFPVDNRRVRAVATLGIYG